MQHYVITGLVIDWTELINYTNELTEELMRGKKRRLDIYMHKKVVSRFLMFLLIKIGKLYIWLIESCQKWFSLQRCAFLF